MSQKHVQVPGDQPVGFVVGMPRDTLNVLYVAGPPTGVPEPVYLRLGSGHAEGIVDAWPDTIVLVPVVGHTVTLRVPGEGGYGTRVQVSAVCRTACRIAVSARPF